MDGKNRQDIHIGNKVSVILKIDQKTGNSTDGIVAKILTKSNFHPHGIKVMLDNGQVGRVCKVIDDL